MKGRLRRFATRVKDLVARSPLGGPARRLARAVLGPGRNELYDRQTREVMGRVLRPDSACVDAGAHEGEILREMIALAPRGRHFAFEPLPHLAAGLREEWPGVTVFECALGATEGRSEFLHVRNAPGYSGLRRRSYDRADVEIETLDVRVRTIDGTIPADAEIAFVKLDIEGGEYHALLGAADTLRRCRPIVVFEASTRSTGHYGVDADDMYALITDELGMRVSTMDRWLNGRPPLTAREFAGHWHHGPEFYFIAYDPAARPAAPR